MVPDVARPSIALATCIQSPLHYNGRCYYPTVSLPSSSELKFRDASFACLPSPQVSRLIDDADPCFEALHATSRMGLGVPNLGPPACASRTLAAASWALGVTLPHVVEPAPAYRHHAHEIATVVCPHPFYTTARASPTLSSTLFGLSFLRPPSTVRATNLQGSALPTAELC